MRILVVTHTFPPESSGGAVRTHDMSRLWVSEGHEVIIVTGFPNHPHGRIPAGYRGKVFLEEQQEGLRVRRSYIYATPTRSLVRRLVNHSSLTVSGVLANLRGVKPDTVVGSSPPLFMGVSGAVLAWWHRVPFVFEVRDLWPQQAVDLGAVKNRLFIWLMEVLERWLYRIAGAVVVVTPGTRQVLIDRGVPAEKVHVVMNGVEVPSVMEEPDRSLADELGVAGRFVVSYVGTMGFSQGLSFVLEAARRLMTELPIALFLLVGDGAERESLVRQAHELGLDNVQFLPIQPRDRVSAIYRLSKAALVPLRDVPLFRITIPSKLFELMGFGVPIIVSVGGEASQIVSAARAGVCVEPDDVDGLVQAIKRLAAQPETLKLMSQCGREYAVRNCDRRRDAAKYISILQATASLHR